MPTSAGKTRIEELCILRALAAGRRVVYVTPLRALSAQVEWTLGKTFRALGYSVSSLYGASGVTDIVQAEDLILSANHHGDSFSGSSGGSTSSPVRAFSRSRLAFLSASIASFPSLSTRIRMSTARFSSPQFT